MTSSEIRAFFIVTQVMAVQVVPRGPVRDQGHWDTPVIALYLQMSPVVTLYLQMSNYLRILVLLKIWTARMGNFTLPRTGSKFQYKDFKRFTMVNFTSIAISMNCPAGHRLSIRTFCVQSECNADGPVAAVMKSLVFVHIKGQHSIDTSPSCPPLFM